jgi:hypothetical protein
MFNITLLIQVLNFLLAYWLLARFFFKPVLAKISHDAQQEEQLVHAINSCHVMLKIAYNKKKQLWSDALSEFDAYTQFCQVIGIKPKAQSLGVSSVDLPPKMGEYERKQIAHDLAHKIMDMK